MRNTINNTPIFRAMPMSVIFALKAAGMLGRMTTGYRGKPPARFMRMGLK